MSIYTKQRAILNVCVIHFTSKGNAIYQIYQIYTYPNQDIKKKVNNTF